MIYLGSILFTLCFALYFKWQNQDEYDGTFSYNKNDKKWHFYGAGMRFLFFATLLYYSIFPPLLIKDVILATVISMPLYDIFINIFALKKPIFYPGSSSSYDKFLGKFKWVLYLLLIIGSLVYYFV